MEPLTPQLLLMHVLAADSSAAAARGRYIYPARGWRERAKLLPRARQRMEGLDSYAPLRTWVREHLARSPDLIAIERLIQDAPPALAEGLRRKQVANVVQHALRSAGARRLGVIAGISGYWGAGARLWALRETERYAAMTPDDLARAYKMQGRVAAVRRYRRADHAAGDDAVRWLHHNAPTMAAMVYAADLAALLPDLPLTPGQRVRAAERYLHEIGATQLGEHQTPHGRRKLWATRDVDRLAAMKPRDRMREVFGIEPRFRNQYSGGRQ